MKLNDCISVLWINFNVFFMISLFFIFLALYLVTKYHSNKLTKEVDTARANLKKTGEKIKVKYHELEIKKNCWIQEIEVDSDIGSKNEYININLNLIIFKKKHHGHFFKEEYRIDMEPEILRMKLALQNELWFYYDSKDFDNNFLDLDFLFN